MKLYSIPGVNGLGKTKGVENNFQYFSKNYSLEFVYLDKEDIRKQLSQIEFKAKEIVNERFFVLGGDHSISYPLVKIFFEKYGQNAKLLVFDAHPDLIEPMIEPTHEEWLRAIIEIGFNKENILLVGIRRDSENIDKKEILFANENNIRIIYADEFEEKKKDILKFASEGKIYLSFDIDVFDSSIISSTGYPEKNGLNEKQFFFILKKLSSKIFAGDLVELNLNKGTNEANRKALLVSRKVLKTVLNTK